MRASKEGSLVVRKHNELIEAKYKLSLNEQRLILNLITIISPDDDDFADYVIRASDVAEMFGVHDKDFYVKIQDAVKTLMTRTVDISKDDVVELVHWFSNIRYVKGSGKISVRFDKALRPYLFQLKDHFTQYQIGAIAQFKSSYSVRFYELLKVKEFQGKGGQFYRVFSIEDIRKYMQLEKNEYSVFQDLKKRVIAPALKEIDEHSDLGIIQVDYIKKGKSIAEVKITVEPKKQIVLDLDVLTDDKKELNDATKTLMTFGVTEDTATKWVRKFGVGKVLRNVAYTLAMQKSGEVKNPIAYLAKCIELDAGKGWEEEQRKREEQQKQTIENEQHKEEKLEEPRHNGQQDNIAALDKFWSLSEITQDAMRDIFFSQRSDALKKIWKEEIKKGNKPEDRAMFRHDFVEFIKTENIL
jgi:plasmid replication initiation protein